MRRTYKSKKDTAGAIDPRDVLLTMDAKSSVFDAFYIQNIKQTKRDMSVGSTMQFAASNKVRKRKYVKRLKEQDAAHPPKESSSGTAFLTPDKSFRVNKAPDLFDQLLNSSCNKIDTPESFSKPTLKRTTHVKRQPYKKRINYSNSDSTDSDKENWNDGTTADKTANSSDIKSHKLLIERELKTEAIPIDKSINDIVNNLSIFTKLKNQTMATPKNNNILTKTTQPLQTSPLCSTPFLEKYRGKSIYRFSPISINLDDSPKCITVTYENEDKINMTDEEKDKNGNKMDVKETVDINKFHSIIPPEDNFGNHFEVNNRTDTAFAIHESYKSSNNTTDLQSPILPKGTIPYKGEIKPLPHSCFENTEMEPFYGFGNSNNSNNSNLVNNKQLSINSHEYKELEDILIEDNSLDTMNTRSLDSTCRDNNVNSIGDNNEHTSNSNTSVYSDSCESCYDTCNSDENFEELNQNLEPVVVVERLNDSVFNRYYELMQKSAEADDLNASSDLNESCDYSSVTDSDSVSDTSSNNTDVSEKSVPEENSLNITEFVNYVGNDESIIYDEIDNSNKSKTEEEVCVSFVTTRRKKLRNDSFMLGLDNSNTSASSNDVDKTVLKKYSPENTSCVTLAENYIEHTLSNDQIDQNSKSTTESDENSGHAEMAPALPRMLTRRSARNTLNTKKSPTNVPEVEEHHGSQNLAIRKSSRIDRDNAKECQNSILYEQNVANDSMSCEKPGIVLQPGKRWERSLSIYRRITTMSEHFDHIILDEEPLHGKGRKYRQSVITTMELQEKGSLHNVSIKSRRSTFVSKPSRSTIKIVRESNQSRDSLCSSIVCEDLQGFLGEDCDDTIVELSKLSIADSEHEVTLIENFHDTSNRITTARDYVLRRCKQTDVLLFDECYPDPLLKNCRKIGEGVYGEVFLWRAGDGRARVLKVIPIAGSIKVNGEQQKEFHEILSEIVIAMELSALRAPIAAIQEHLNEGKILETLDLHSVENATDVFNEVLSVRCVRGLYPSRLLDLWELYDESRGSENDNPAVLPADQQYIVLELANAGQDLEGYQFVNAEQSYALFKQIAFGLAVAEEAYQFEHRDLHWGNVLISPTDQEEWWCVVRGRRLCVRAAGVRASIIDYSLSRACVRRRALYNDLAADDALFDALGDYQFQVYRLMRDKLGNDWKNFEPYTNILWLHYTLDKMITALRYTRTNTKIHKLYIAKLKEVKNRILDYGSAVQFVLTDNEL